jgi:hypothetical protein
MAVFCSAISSLVGCGTSLGVFWATFYDICRDTARVHLIFANIFVGAKHSGSKSLLLTNKLCAGMLRPYKSSKSLLLTNKLCAGMLRPYKIGMHPTALPCPARGSDVIIGLSNIEY